MKTDKNSQATTPSGTLPQPEQTVPDNNQKQFKATYFCTFEWKAVVIIEADSLNQAKHLATRVQASDLIGKEVEPTEYWQIVYSVEAVKGENSHE